METKKSSVADLNRRRSMFFFSALTISLSVILMAFEWKFQEDQQTLQYTCSFDEMIDLDEIPQTVQNFQRLTKTQLSPVDESSNDKNPTGDNKSTMDTVILDNMAEAAMLPEEKAEEEVICIYIEEKPQFAGGDAEMYRFIAKNLRYPAINGKMEFAGRVFVQFVVEKDGSISEVKTIKGVTSGLDKEAERVIKSMPKWTPGKQRGVPVKVRMIIPVFFKLNN